jgi:hypothetical protein
MHYWIDPITDSRWPEFILRHPSSSVFHTPAWLTALQRTYGYTPLVLTTSPPGSKIENGIPFCRVNSILTGNRLVSLPFSDHWQPHAKVREAVRAKFYFFDAGVVRILANRVRDPLTNGEKGPLLETFRLHDIRAAAAHLNVGGEICYWHTPAGVEIDFIWARGDNAVVPEVKRGSQRRSEYSSPLPAGIGRKKRFQKAMESIRGPGFFGQEWCRYFRFRISLCAFGPGRCLNKNRSATDFTHYKIECEWSATTRDRHSIGTNSAEQIHFVLTSSAPLSFRDIFEYF